MKTILAILIVALLAFGCAQTSPQNPNGGALVNQSSSTNQGAGNIIPNTSASGVSSSATVDIKGFAFNPAVLEISAGTKVTWTNNDPATHTVVSDTGAFDTGSITNGQSVSFTFTQSGTYAYHCSVHPSMKATIVVK